MKLQTTITPRRDGTVTLTAKDGQKCVFAPGPDGNLVCDVDDESTVAELINGGLFFPADPEDFEAALKLASAADAIVPPPAAGTVLLGSSNFDPVLDVGDKQVQLGEVVAAAFTASGMTAEAWNALGEDERDDLIEAELTRMEGVEVEMPAGGLPLEANTPPAEAPKATSKGGKKAGK